LIQFDCAYPDLVAPLVAPPGTSACAENAAIVKAVNAPNARKVLELLAFMAVSPLGC
jgi:cytidine deaminase